MIPPGSRVRRRWVVLGGALVAVGWLVRPASEAEVPTPTDTEFRWNAAELFEELEAQFGRTLLQDAVEAGVAVDGLAAEGDSLLALAAVSPTPPYDALDRLATLQFELAVRGGAHPTLMPGVLDFVVRARRDVLGAAAVWPMDRATQEALYRVVFGGRIALDEALVQAGPDALPALVPIEDVQSATPSIVVEGVTIHSGDILLSRGGAPTSALIARGSDFPNTFSHAALVYVDATTGEGTVIESLIEAGAVTGTVDEYLESKKHRILVLRLSPDHPAFGADTLLPHRAAASMLERVRAQHLPYDFAMEWDDPSAVFCSEIIYHAYRDLDVDLWALRGAMSAPGLVRWLAGMGVREFSTLVPSDLELDPQLRAVAEWRDAPALMDYRLDNAITDALLEQADRGAELGYAWYALPGARLLKGYSLLQSALGRRPTVPEGMSPAAALRVAALVSRVNPTVRVELGELAETFREEHGYEAPYWDLVDLAREALATVGPSLAPALNLEES